MTAGSIGADLIAAIVAEMAVEGVQPTAMEVALLRTAGQLVDRLAALEAAVEREGEIIVSKTGVTPRTPSRDRAPAGRRDPAEGARTASSWGTRPLAR
jgi:hypothetical protein